MTVTGIITDTIGSSGNSISFGSEDLSTSGNISTGNSTVSGDLDVSGNSTISSSTLGGRLKLNVGDYNYSPGNTGIVLDTVGNKLYTDNVTQANQTAASLNLFSLNKSRIAAQKSNVTTTNATTLYVEGAPLSDNNMTFTNSRAVWIKEGLTELGGNAIINGSLTLNNNADISGSITSGAVSVTGMVISVQLLRLLPVLRQNSNY